MLCFFYQGLHNKAMRKLRVNAVKSLKVWFVDNRLENRETWMRSFPEKVVSENEFEAFSSVEGLFQKIDSGRVPDILFLDFFINGVYGLHVINHLKKLKINSPLIIAHSSMEAANDAMIKAGAHLKMEKIKGAPITESIASKVKSSEDLRRLLALRNESK